MLRTLGTITLLTLAVVIPFKEAAAQDPLGGAILGGATGAIIGGVAGGGRGAAIGAGIGAATGAIIAAEGQRRRGGYYYWRQGCYSLTAGFGFPRVIADKSLRCRGGAIAWPRSPVISLAGSLCQYSERNRGGCQCRRAFAESSGPEELLALHHCTQS